MSIRCLFGPPLIALAVEAPERLAAVLADPATLSWDLSWGAECLGARWTPGRWWPTLRALLRHERITVREGALIGLMGLQTEPDMPDGFYARSWPEDVEENMRTSILEELERVATEDSHQLIREMADEAAVELRAGCKWLDRVLLGEVTA